MKSKNKLRIKMIKMLKKMDKKINQRNFYKVEEQEEKKKQIRNNSKNNNL